MARKARYGTGKRFAAMVASGKSPALSAWIGRRAHGKASFQKVAAAGRRRAARLRRSK